MWGAYILYQSSDPKSGHEDVTRRADCQISMSLSGFAQKSSIAAHVFILRHGFPEFVRHLRVSIIPLLPMTEFHQHKDHIASTIAKDS